MTHRFWKFDPANAARLLADERAGIHPRDEALALLELERGQLVADIGCGPGFFTVPMAERILPGGRVAALDIAVDMLQHLRHRIAAAGLRNVLPAQSEESRLPLPGGACDRVLLAFLAHELEAPDVFFREVTRVLRPGGRGLVVDWAPRESPIGPPLDVRVPATSVRERLMRAGLRPGEPAEFGPYSYAVPFVRP
jgi:ubiquinone/menaquinone biosynthesis C-methylase UbiE